MSRAFLALSPCLSWHRNWWSVTFTLQNHEDKVRTLDTAGAAISPATYDNNKVWWPGQSHGAALSRQQAWPCSPVSCCQLTGRSNVETTTSATNSLHLKSHIYSSIFSFNKTELEPGLNLISTILKIPDAMDSGSKERNRWEKMRHHFDNVISSFQICRNPSSCSCIQIRQQANIISIKRMLPTPLAWRLNAQKPLSVFT